MTLGQKIEALVAIRMRQDNIRSCINSSMSPKMIQYTTKWLKDLESAYEAIDAIETTE